MGRWAMLLDWTVTILVVVFTVACVATDVRSRRIPNWLTVPVFALGVALHTTAGGLPGLQASLAGFATGFAILFVLWLLGGGGGGDVKMLSALGAWLGAALVLYAFLASALVTVLIVFWAIVREAVSRWKSHDDVAGKRSSKHGSKRNASTPSSRPGRIVPYAVPLAIGTWAVLAFSWWRYGRLFETWWY